MDYLHNKFVSSFFIDTIFEIKTFAELLNLQ